MDKIPNHTSIDNLMAEKSQPPSLTLLSRIFHACDLRVRRLLSVNRLTLLQLYHTRVRSLAAAIRLDWNVFGDLYSSPVQFVFVISYLY